MDFSGYFTDFFSESLAAVISRLINAVILAACLVIAYFIIKFCIRKLFDRHIKPGEGRNANKVATTRMVVFSLYKYLFLIVAFLMMLGVFEVNVASILTVAGLGGVAIGISGSSILRDMMTGIFIWLEDHFVVGDIVTLGDKTGVVEHLGFRTMKLRDFNGDLHIIPNSEIRIITNKSRDFKRALVDVAVGLGEDIDRVIGIITDELEKAKDELDIDRVESGVLGVSEINGSAIVIRVYAKCSPPDCYAVERALRKRFKQRLEAEGTARPVTAVALTQPGREP